MNKLLQRPARDYFDLIKAAVLVIDRDGKVEFANEWLCFLLGYHCKEMIGKNWFDHFIPGETKRTRVREFKKFISGTGEPVSKRENYAQAKDGNLFLIEWQDNLLKDKEGNILGVLSSGDDITENFILKKHLAEQQAQSRKELMQAVLDAAEIERRQIAYELHDGVNQVLTVCKLLLETEMAHTEPCTIRKVAGQIQGVINDIRVLSHRLNPADLGNEGLYAAIKELIQQTNATGNLYVRLKVGGARYLKMLPPAVSLNLYRIIQEAMNNILKHSGASEATIDLHGSKEAVDLEICDDGKGFLRRTTTGGLGLKTIYTRAEAVGGKGYIASAPGEGTLLSVHIPLGHS